MPLSGSLLRAVILASAVLILSPVSRAAPEGGSERPDLLAYEVTEHVPIIRGRHDKAFQRGLESVFRKSILAALRELDSLHPRDFATLQAGILSRASDFIATYRILFQEEKEGYLTLSVRSEVYRTMLEEAIREAAALSPGLLKRLLILVDTFPITGASEFEDIDAGHLASTVLKMEFLKRGAVIIPGPERLPWQHLEGRATTENRVSLAAAEASRLRADYVLLGRLETRAARLLVLTVQLVSPSSQKVVASASAPVELQSDALPGESFLAPAGELAGALIPRIAVRPGSSP